MASEKMMFRWRNGEGYVTIDRGENRFWFRIDKTPISAIGNTVAREVEQKIYSGQTRVFWRIRMPMFAHTIVCSARDRMLGELSAHFNTTIRTRKKASP